ncbi:hypothetical protein VTJ04DRAFT_6473 [Mycothermus thermophilus]|uniref:uncharacterized protein n=1 Tax=Humicola insolens TaxID=85995 RepID=UPI00374306AB
MGVFFCSSRVWVLGFWRPLRSTAFGVEVSLALLLIGYKSAAAAHGSWDIGKRDWVSLEDGREHLLPSLQAGWSFSC